jgi:hypothetical protein
MDSHSYMYYYIEKALFPEIQRRSDYELHTL